MPSLRQIACSGLLLGCSVLSPAAGCWQYPAEVLDTPAVPSRLAQHSLLLDLAVAGSQIIAVGSRGHIMYSGDLGQHWHQAQVPVSSDLTCVWVQHPQLAFAAGHDGVMLRSKDGGKSWHKLLDGRELGTLYQQYYQPLSAQQPERYELILQEAELLQQQGADKAWLDLLFLDDNTGFAVGAFNLILKTEDGGESWQPLSEFTHNPLNYHLHSISRIGQQLWITGEQGLVLKGTLDGRQFERVETPYPGSLFGAVAAGSQALLFGLRGHALISADQGQSWQMLHTGTEANITAAHWTAHGDLYLSSQIGELLHSRDQGQSFSAVAQARAVPLMALAAASGTLFMVGWQGVTTLPLTQQGN